MGFKMLPAVCICLESRIFPTGDGRTSPTKSGLAFYDAGL